jgi:cytoskeletal protein CcmA (bactofilin family)
MGLFAKAPPPPPPPATTIGRGTSMKGDFTTQRDVVLDGLFEGTLRSASTVCVAAKGGFRGTVHCEVLECEGTSRAEGHVRNIARLLSTCTWEGDLRTRTLRIDRGALVQGRIGMAADKR